MGEVLAHGHHIAADETSAARCKGVLADGCFHTGHHGEEKLGAGKNYFQLFFGFFSGVCMKGLSLLGFVGVFEK
jgi:hypothetical protein